MQGDVQGPRPLRTLHTGPAGVSDVPRSTDSRGLGRRDLTVDLRQTLFQPVTWFTDAIVDSDRVVFFLFFYFFISFLLLCTSTTQSNTDDEKERRQEGSSCSDDDRFDSWRR